ncbi:unnamed protein product [Adineta ricciae]|uniref:NAD(P)(+)--arginine ADP-ribosyltransferase n=1 Tax=Adineta ricciae TaxID=249248 RepID=A0A815NTP7_ADIRI|nr:unnamed protein product [Adineta ricciae]CAF1441237.1 unnamed protein product [Adineta ricciae]
MLPPIRGYENEPLVSLEEAVQPVAQHFTNIDANVHVAKENCAKLDESLTVDESAAIYLYTMVFDEGPNLYEILNSCLRNANRRQIKPWSLFLKLFLTALCKLPSSSRTVWRCVRGVDLTSVYPKGKDIVWWGVGSCIGDVSMLEDDRFLGKNNAGTLFFIESRNAKSIRQYSCEKDTIEEIILMPGSFFRVNDHMPAKNDLHVIHLVENVSPFILLETPFLSRQVLSQHHTVQEIAGIAESKTLVVHARPFDEFSVESSTTDKPTEPSGKA